MAQSTVREVEVPFIPESRRPPEEPIIKGTTMACPRCLTRFNILDFHRLEQTNKFRRQTAPVYRCPKNHGGCGWYFALADEAITGSVNQDG